VRAFNKRVTFTAEEIDALLTKWGEIANRFGLEKFDQALQRCVDEIPGWPDVPEILERIPRAPFVGDWTNEYREQLRANRRAARAWEQTAEYREWHARAVQPLEEKLKARVIEAPRIEISPAAATIEPELERAYIAERARAFEAAHPELAAKLRERFGGQL